MTTVGLQRCDSYAPQQLDAAIRQVLSLSGFDLTSLKGGRVLVKPNLLTASVPEQGVVTHPEVFRTVVRLVKEYGGTPVLIESPASLSLRRVMERTGYARIVEEEGVEVDPLTEVMVIHNPRGEHFRRFEVAKGLGEVDCVINLPKFKTHSITYITGAVKNLFGLIPGRRKAQWHLRAQEKQDFAGFILDYYGALLDSLTPSRPIIHLMDAITVLEGEGPGVSGSPRQLGALLAGVDGLAVDRVAVSLAGLDPELVPTLVLGVRRGLGGAMLDDIEVAGDGLDDLTVTDFIPPGGGRHDRALRWPLTAPFVKNLLVERPVPDPARCTLCYQCRQICPAEAISVATSPVQVPRFDYARCIRCYCCMEVCPEAAIHVRPNLAQRLFRRG